MLTKGYVHEKTWGDNSTWVCLAALLCSGTLQQIVGVCVCEIIKSRLISFWLDVVYILAPNWHLKIHETFLATVR